MKRILIGYITKDLGSGINQYILNFVNNIQDKDIEIDFLVREDEKYLDTIKKDILCNINYKNLFFVSNNKKPLKLMSQLKEILNKRKYDIAYFNISSAHDSIGIMAAKKCGVKEVIVHSHSSNADGNSVIKTEIKKTLNKLGKLVLSKNVDKYLACSDKAAKWLFPSYIYNTSNYEIIYNRIDSKKFKYNKTIREKIRKKYKLEDKFVIGHIGRFKIPQKNNLFVVDILSKMLEKDKNTRLICIGDGIDFEKTKEYAKKKGLINKIIFTGRINNVNEYMQAFDAFILPSKYEGLPITGIEAQFSNIPSFFSDTITDEIIISENSKRLSIKNVDEWTEELNKVKKKRENKLLDKAINYDIKNDYQSKEIINNTSKIDKHNIDNSNLFTILKTTLLIHYICNLSSYLNGFNYLTVIAGLLMMSIFIKNIKGIKDLLKNKIYLLLLLFIISYLLSISLNQIYDLNTSIKVFIWTVVNLLFTNYYLYLINDRQCKEELKNFLLLLVFLVGILNILNLIQLITIKEGIITSFGGEKIVTGITAWGRFYGVFYDPNYASVICTIAIISGLYLIKEINKKYLKGIILGLTIIAYIYICLCQSRSGLFTFAVGTTTYLLMKYVLNEKGKIIKTLSIILIILLFIGIIPKFTLKTYNFIKDSTIETISKKENNKKIAQKEDVDINRKDNRKDISNRRFDIWKSGAEIFKTKPIYGVGYGNVEGYAKENIPNTYIVNNSFATFRVFHNFVIDILVNQGIIGLIIIIILTFYILRRFIQNKKAILNNKNEIALLVSSIIAILFSGMFLSQIFYVNNAVTFTFWLLFGYLNYYIMRCKNEK